MQFIKCVMRKIPTKIKLKNSYFTHLLLPKMASFLKLYHVMKER